MKLQKWFRAVALATFALSVAVGCQALTRAEAAEAEKSRLATQRLAISTRRHLEVLLGPSRKGTSFRQSDAQTNLT